MLSCQGLHSAALDQTAWLWQFSLPNLRMKKLYVELPLMWFTTVCPFWKPSEWVFSTFLHFPKWVVGSFKCPQTYEPTMNLGPRPTWLTISLGGTSIKVKYIYICQSLVLIYFILLHYLLFIYCLCLNWATQNDKGQSWVRCIMHSNDPLLTNTPSKHFRSLLSP